MWEWIVLLAAVIGVAPVFLSLRIYISEEPSFSIVAYIYGIRLQFDRPLKLDASLLTRQGFKNLSFKDIVSIFYHLLLDAKWSDSSATCRVGTGDACTTALASGALAALLHALGSSVGMRVKVSPEFRRPFFALSMRCILSFRGGDIIVAGAKALRGRKPIKRKVEMANGQASH